MCKSSSVSVCIVAKGEITAKKVNVDESNPAAASIGNGTLKAGDVQTTITTKAVDRKSRIFVTPRDKTGGQPLEVGAITDDGSFTVTVEHTYTSDISFDWWIVN